MVRVALCVAMLVPLLAVPPALAADAAAGREKAQMCGVCHGLDGIGRNPDVPNIAGDPEVYTRQQLRAFRGGERQHAQMSIIAQGLSDEDIADLAAYYAAIEVSVTVPDY